jgi:hypothetical protein
MDAAITVIKPFYAKFRHIRKSTVVVSVAALFNVRICRALYPNLFKKYAARKQCRPEIYFAVPSCQISFSHVRCYGFGNMR